MNRKRLIIIASLILIPLLGLLIFRSLTFRATGTVPGLKQVSVISPFIDITFSKPVDNKSVTIFSDTTIVEGHEVVNKKTLRVFFRGLELGSDNTVVVKSIKSTKGKELKNLSYSFTARDIPFEEMSQAQQQAILKNQDKPSPTKSDPILAHVPYGGLNYELTAVAREGNLILHAKLLLSAADARIDAAAAAEQYKKEVQDYIKSVGLDPAKYTIEYEVIQPSL